MKRAGKRTRLDERIELKSRIRQNDINPELLASMHRTIQHRRAKVYSMTPLQMIEEWRKGCGCAPAARPEECHECTRGLIDALESRLRDDALKAEDIPIETLRRVPGFVEAKQEG